MTQFKSPFPQSQQPPQYPQQEPHSGYPQWPQPPQQWYPQQQPPYYQQPQVLPPPQHWYPPQPQYCQTPPQVLPPQYLPQPFYQPPITPVPQLPQAKPKALRNYIIAALVGALTVIVILTVIIEVDSQGKNGNGSSPTAQVTATSQPTATPTPIPTPTPTDTPVSGIDQAVVGGTEAAFTDKFGDPASQQTEQNGAEELIFDVGSSTIGQLGIVVLSGASVVYGVAIAAPNGQSWDATTAVNVCISYLPSDSTLGKPQEITDSTGSVVGLFVSGYSAELANTLSPTYFNDAKGTSLVKPGTFSIRYTADGADTGATLCAIRLGIQSTSA